MKKVYEWVVIFVRLVRKIGTYKSQVSTWLARSMLKRLLNFTRILISVLPCIFQDIAAKPPTLGWEGLKPPQLPYSEGPAGHEESENDEVMPNGSATLTLLKVGHRAFTSLGSQARCFKVLKSLGWPLKRYNKLSILP